MNKSEGGVVYRRGRFGGMSFGTASSSVAFLVIIIIRLHLNEWYQPETTNLHQPSPTGH